MSTYQVSKETQDKNAIFEQAEAAFKASLEAFERTHELELIALDKLREDRNAKLDEVKRALRAEAVDADITEVKFIKIGKFSVQKKWTHYYSPEKFVALLKDKGLYDSALSAKIVAEKIEVAKFEQAEAFLKTEGVAKDFEECEDGQELTPAITGPKPVPAFGAEQKDAK